MRRISRDSGRNSRMVADIVSRIVGGAFLAIAGWGLGGYITDIWGPERFVLWAFGLAISGGLIGLILTLLFWGESIRASRNKPIPFPRPECCPE